MPGVISKLASWVRELRHFFLRLLNRLQSMVLRNQKSDENALKLFWIEDRRIKICEEIFAVDLEILAYIRRSHPTTFDEKLRKFVAEKQALIDSWRNPTLPENLEPLPSDPERRRQLCVQRAERCKKLYDDLAQYKTVYNEVIDEVGIVLTFDEKLHFTKPFSLFDPTCTCCFLEVVFHFPPLSPATASSKPQKITAAPVEDENDIVDETAPLLENENAETIEENEETTDHSEFLSPRSKLSDSSFQSCEPFQSPTSVHDMRTLRTGSPSNNLRLDDEEESSSDETWNGKNAGESSSSSSAAEGSIHTGKDSSSSEEDYGKKSEDDDYVGGNGSDEAKENGLGESKNSVINESAQSSQIDHSFRG